MLLVLGSINFPKSKCTPHRIKSGKNYSNAYTTLLSTLIYILFYNTAFCCISFLSLRLNTNITYYRPNKNKVVSVVYFI